MSRVLYARKGACQAEPVVHVWFTEPLPKQGFVKLLCVMLYCYSAQQCRVSSEQEQDSMQIPGNIESQCTKRIDNSAHTCHVTEPAPLQGSLRALPRRPAYDWAE